MMQRTHRARNDLDWAPTSTRVLRWLTHGGLLASGVAAGTALSWLSHNPDPLHFLPSSLFAGQVVGEWAARSLVRRRIAQLSRGNVNLARLEQERDGALVHVRGRVRAVQTLPGLIDPRPAVYRRLAFSVYGKGFFHEAAVDFMLVAPNGEEIAMYVEGARLIVPHPPLRELVGDEIERVDRLPFAPLIGLKRYRAKKLQGGEMLLQDGDAVEVVGYKRRIVDPTVTERLERETPMRTTLRSGRQLPLIITPVYEPAP
jgi:hypothetical protein